MKLWADIRNPLDKSTTWVKVAQRRSTAVVVRGRPPNHYQNEGRQSASSCGEDGGSGASGSGLYPPGDGGGTG